MVKDIFKLAFVIFVIFTFSSCSKKIYESNWQSTSNIEDLKAPEWQIPLKYFDSKSKLQYIISNDDKNLYIVNSNNIRILDIAKKVFSYQANNSCTFSTFLQNEKYPDLGFIDNKFLVNSYYTIDSILIFDFINRKFTNKIFIDSSYCA